MSREIEVGSSAEIDYEVGQTVQLNTDHWKEVVGARGDEGEIIRFGPDGDDLFGFAWVRMKDSGELFPFLLSEIAKVEAGQGR
ncbi:hypothetical protein ABZ348_31235 [Streptomyces sp. NPDC005963]|uniref:hypothetical protein n=1 Tax=Streptomyces sp. NPDC005963 TaxID=3156721 RepID=UPI0033C00EA8